MYLRNRVLSLLVMLIVSSAGAVAQNLPGPKTSDNNPRPRNLAILIFDGVEIIDYTAATLTHTVRLTDDQGNQVSSTLVVPVTRATDAIAPATQQAAPAPTPPPVNGGLPVVSPDGSHIVFSSNRSGNGDLFIISADGTGETQLTHTPEEENAPGWTADSKHVVFSVFANETSHFYSIDLDGKNQREISSVAGRAPMLSPDGKRLVYMAGTWTATRLMVSALDGSNARQINDGSSIAWNNHWSPDGKRIAFTGKNESAEGIAVFVMNADGSERRQVTQIKPEEGRAQWPVWSPNGRQLAIQVSNLKTHSGHVWTVDVGSGEAHKLAAHDQSYLDETPSWFPDGKRIAFQSNRTGKMEVWVMNADGSGQRQVTVTGN